MSVTDYERVLALHAGVGNRVGDMELPARWTLQGLGAQSLLEARLAALTGDGKWTRLAHGSLASAFGLLSESDAWLMSLHQGLAGVAWVARLVNRVLAPADRFDVTDADDILLEYLSSPEAWDGDFDVIIGATGCAVQAFAHPDEQRRAQMLDAYVRLLSSRAESSAQGVWWKSPPRFGSDGQRIVEPEGAYNLGVAHGIPGVTAMLARVAAEGIASRDLTHLLEGSVAACISELRTDSVSHREVIGYLSGDGAIARCAWCYGEPGLAAALAAAGKALGDRRLRDRAHTLFRSSVTRPDTSTMLLLDTGLCHGWAGLYVISEYLEALVPGESPGPCPIQARCLGEMRDACDTALAHGQVPLFGPTERGGPTRDPRFLTGTLGVAHALLDAAFPDSRADLPWTDCVLM